MVEIDVASVEIAIHRFMGIGERRISVIGKDRMLKQRLCSYRRWVCTSQVSRVQCLFVFFLCFYLSPFSSLPCVERVQRKSYLAIELVAAGVMLRGRVIPIVEVKYCARAVKKSANDNMVTVIRSLLMRMKILVGCTYA